jgi:hypothetical protein
MERRHFISTSVAGAVGGFVATTLGDGSDAEAAQPSAATRALNALKAARRTETARNAGLLRGVYHSDAIRLDPASVTPIVGRAAVAERLGGPNVDRQLQYFYYRQPRTVVEGNTALVVSNFEAGQTIGGRTVEDSGKTAAIVMLGSNPPLIAAEAVVPNIYAGSYGSRGTALARPRFGRFPLRALPQPPVRAATAAGGGENDRLFSLVRRINQAWVQQRPQDILQVSQGGGTNAFLIGDYSPFYISGREDIQEHFSDFYSTGRVNSIAEVNPTVKIFGNMAAVAFDFDLDYAINNQQRRAPGHALYTFTRSGGSWLMSSCSATHLVLAEIGDPYPLPSG